MGDKRAIIIVEGAMRHEQVTEILSFFESRKEVETIEVVFAPPSHEHDDKGAS